MSRRTRPDAGWARPSKMQRGPNGRLLCRLCGIEVPKGRRTFCSPDCVHRWRLDSDPGYLRDCVEKRDRGVCVDCALDTIKFMKEVEAFKHTKGYAAYRVWIKELKLGGRYTYWEADHVIGIADGGTNDLTNVVTRCLCCHRAKSAASQTARAAARRAAREAEQAAIDCPLFPGGTRDAESL